MKTVTMVSPRTFVLNTVHPVSFQITAGVQIKLPLSHMPDALAAGMSIVDNTPVVEEVNTPHVPTAEEREATIFTAFGNLVETNISENFTGSGVPSAAVILQQTSIKISQKDINAMWDKYTSLVKEAG